MMKRYGIVLLLALVGVVLVSVLLRMPKSRAVPRAAAVTAIAAVAVTVDLYADRVTTDPGSIPAGTTVKLAMTNHRTTPARVALAGYEEQVLNLALAPSSTWHTTFRADRPGEHFAWLVDGQPRGRLDVRGSHLMEGHR